MVSATKVQNSATQGLNLFGFADFYFYGFSCDYNPTCGTTNIAHFYGAHFEQAAGRMLTIAGSSLSATEIIGGEIVYTRPSGAESDVIYVNSADNPMFRIVGTLVDISIGHTFRYLVNWNGSGDFAQLDIEDVPYPGGTLLNLTNSTCTFIGCYIHDGSLGVYANNFRGGFISAAEARFPKVSTDGGRGASIGSTLGDASITGGRSGLRIDPTRDSTASPLFLQEGKMNASSFEATFRSVRSTTLSGTGNAVACLDAAGRLYRGTSTGCP